MTVREWFRGMRQGDDALSFAIDVECALKRQGMRAYIRCGDIDLIFDLKAYEASLRRNFFAHRILD